MKNKGVAYLLWLTGFIGLAGIHRFYAGKYVTGFLWLITGGFLGIGQFIDLLLIPGMIEEQNRDRRRLEVYGNNGLNPSLIANYNGDRNIHVPLEQQRSDIQIILQLAKDSHDGISVADCVLATGKSIDEVKKVLQNLYAEGLLEVDNRETTGAVVYRYV